MRGPDSLDHHQTLTSLLAPLLGSRESPLFLKIRQLRGGIDSMGVAHVTARFSAAGAMRSRRLVWKRTLRAQMREARVYEEILASASPRIAPELTAVRYTSEECWLFLESIRPTSKWPWRDIRESAQVMHALANLHTWQQFPAHHAPWLNEWDYENELTTRSKQLVDALEQLPAVSAFKRLRQRLGAVRRLHASLPRWRTWLLGLEPFGRTFIHGDVHPGNVMMRKDRDSVAPVFIDWGRSRIGSPLEDVSSWLQSLGYWEPTARCRHDSLLMGYLETRNLPRELTREWRDAYWLAAASNLLAGAILYHLAILTDPGSSAAQRLAACSAAMDALRVIHRADACWRSREP